MSQIRRQFLTLLCSTLCGLSFCQAGAAELPKVSIKTNLGEIVIELYPDAAPKTVANFLAYVKSGQYKGTLFHRVIDNFMVQGGGYDKNFKEKAVRPAIVSESRSALDHGLKNTKGTLAMARTEDPNSATAQFFINVKDNDFLDHQIIPAGDPVSFTYRGNIVTAPRRQALAATAGYTPFGKVIQGMDVVEKIQTSATGESHMMPNVPNKNIVIESATVIK
ncbi:MULTISPECIES: peptidylprolyl isomerase [unclassified Undibacterium]|uniref:peptidylprolyl isomerase n=1 Tax=unclassified Undibacterium TaxID=2630295 RepID=UPI002AC9BFF0|nr:MULTISPECIES: peptidylprolyl isomerase [unclassified Undibacterium]MEB0138726.1 peptidylprolyl isomerase [Undibacterium sp. CCC2.1]MEB0171527.1 peptidylprolyl isomerase [Undibacterium sp. CCC1.1]MEB0175402.1 peptidylprolyl isomerase [Undibacterium sp. CCC3.4]MEB0214727.1 peptidylprolyl isomerase [Undibacterium sp. 5I2]WPX43315.1 peptidylprolyl isomerase [Undibacterium sp. CCC3.4]